ncbi:hypothetical protein O6H91_10G006000 [Diphasiastrum complanatum]|uniref:Uncharacterized protein n=1 Tax=Diphasiastrum complanatum TaxID=34168 RepID=A0ACC2CDZ6_DIPCM|nr:hypothetical protein O6H91_10G006000 [Diphasiastrum complanatum]
MNGGEGRGDHAPSAGASNSNRIMIEVGGGSDQANNAAPAAATAPATPSRYEAQKRRDWNTFGQYLRNHRPPLALARCSGANVLEFLHYLDQFGKTKVHIPACPYFGLLHPPSPCACPLRQAWGSLDALIGRLRAAYEEHGGKPETNPFGARTVRNYLREVREHQAKARGISHQKKKRKPRPTAGSASSSQLPPPSAPATAAAAPAPASDSIPALNPIHLLSVHDPRYVDTAPEDSHLRLLS